MDYIGKKCPVCDEYFHVGDDIVVCPECGTPHHRECYDKNGKCANEQLHKDGYDYMKDNDSNTDSNVSVCKRCGHQNDSQSFFCNKCGYPLGDNQQNTNNQRTVFYGVPFQNGNPNQNADDSSAQSTDNPNFSGTQNNNGYGGYSNYNNNQGAPYGMPFDPFDPLAGVPADTDMGNSVTAGEMSKYVKQNTQYFIRVFSNIKNFAKSKFNFSAAIFTGVYLLYRKMYKIGAVISAIQLAILAFSVYIDYYVLSSSEFTTILTKLTNLAYGGLGQQAVASGFAELMGSLTPYQIFVLYVPAIFNIIQIAMMIVIGCCANRLYYNHCIKHISKIKKNCADKTQSDTVLQTKGGVNMALALSIFISFAIIYYLPTLLMNF